MNEEKPIDPKERILQATLALLNEEPDVDKITVRRIAERAGVGIGLINYHFQSRDNLLNQAVTGLMESLANNILQDQPGETESTARARIKLLLKETSLVALRYPSIARIPINHIIQHGDYGTEMMILPLLREMYGKEKDEIRLRMIAMALIMPLQVAFMNPEAFRMYTGLSLLDPHQIDQILDLFVDSILN